MSATTWLESAMVGEGKEDRGGGGRFDQIVTLLKLEILPFTVEQARLARSAFKKYGKDDKRERPYRSVTVLPTHLPRTLAHRSCSKAMTSFIQTSNAPEQIGESVPPALAAHKCDKPRRGSSTPVSALANLACECHFVS